MMSAGKKMLKEYGGLSWFLLLFTCASGGLLFGKHAVHGSRLDSVSFPRSPASISTTKRALVLVLTHESLRPSAIDSKLMNRVMEQVRQTFVGLSHGAFVLESVILESPLVLPGEYTQYSVSRTKELSDAASEAILKTYRGTVDPSTFDILIYFYPTDTNAAPFDMTWKRTSGSRYTPAVLNIGFGMRTRSETIVHEIGHALLLFGHAGSADPKTGETLEPTGDPYELMGYGWNRNLYNPTDLGMVYRYYWGWADKDDIQVVLEPDTVRLEPGKALLVMTGKGTLLWLEIIRAEQAYAGETGGLLVRIDKSTPRNIAHMTLDMTPDTTFSADLHLDPGRSVDFEGRHITYLRRIEEEHGVTPAAEIRISNSDQ